MLPAALTVKAIQLCAAGLGVTGSSASARYAVVVRAGAVLAGQPSNQADASATVRDLIALGADFDAGPLAISSADFASFGVTPVSVFDACALAHVEGEPLPVRTAGPATLPSITTLLRQAFAAKITDTVRPTNASYGVRYSWHKFGQAVDFVPAGGVRTITREQIRRLMDANGVRLIELLGPGDRGHSNHWHVAFARPGQVIDRLPPIEGDEDWFVNVATVVTPRVPFGAAATPVAAPTSLSAEEVAPHWDVFAAADRRPLRGGRS